VDADLAAKPRALAERVRRNVPLRRDPERFHVAKSCICQDLEHMAERLDVLVGAICANATVATVVMAAIAIMNDLRIVSSWIGRVEEQQHPDNPDFQYLFRRRFVA